MPESRLYLYKLIGITLIQASVTMFQTQFFVPTISEENDGLFFGLVFFFRQFSTLSVAILTKFFYISRKILLCSAQIKNFIIFVFLSKDMGILRLPICPFSDNKRAINFLLLTRKHIRNSSKLH